MYTTDSSPTGGSEIKEKDYLTLRFPVGGSTREGLLTLRKKVTDTRRRQVGESKPEGVVRGCWVGVREEVLPTGVHTLLEVVDKPRN